MSIPKDIRNAIQLAKHNKLGWLTNVKVAVEKPQKISWRHSFKEDENGRLTDLVYVPPEGLRLFQRFLTVICGFRAVGHCIFNRDALWPPVRKDLLLRL